MADPIKRHRVKAEALRRLGGCCVVCGTRDALQFDHIDPVTKEFNISSNLDSLKLWNELAKCQLLCAEHHKAKTRATSHAKPNARGERHFNSKLRSLDVLYIRGLSALGYSQPAIAREFGVGRSTVEDVLHRRTWRHV